MSWQIVVGALLAALPILGIIAVMVRISGWRMVAEVWAVTLVFTAMIGAGVFLIRGGR